MGPKLTPDLSGTRCQADASYFQVFHRLKSQSFDDNELPSSEDSKFCFVDNQEKDKLEASLNDLCLKIKRVSDRNLSSSRSRRGFSAGLAGSSLDGTEMRRPPLRKATSLLDAREALQATCNG